MSSLVVETSPVSWAWPYLQLYDHHANFNRKNMPALFTNQFHAVQNKTCLAIYSIYSVCWINKKKFEELNKCQSTSGHLQNQGPREKSCIFLYSVFKKKTVLIFKCTAQYLWLYLQLQQSFMEWIIFYW